MKTSPARRAARRAAATPASAASAAWLSGALAGAVLLAFVAWYVEHERCIWFWDQAGYWLKTLAIAERLPHDPLGTLATVLRTIRRDDYNQLIALPLAPVVVAFGDGRLVYVLAIAVLYGLVAAASIALFTERAFLRPRHAAPLAVAIAIVSIVVTPRFWLPVLEGLPDVAGCIVLPLCWWALREPLEDLSLRRTVVLAAALTLLIVLRRWYGYAVLALLLAVGVEQVIRIGFAARHRARLRAAAARLALLTGATLVLLLVTTGGQGVAMLTTDYARIYAAYRGASPLLDAARALPRDLGWFRLVLAVSGGVLVLRDAPTRPLARLVVLQTVLAAVLFARTQSFNAHHEYLVLPQLAALVAVASAAIVGTGRGGRVRALLLVVLFVVDFAVPLVPGVQNALGPAALAFGRIASPPVVRADLDEVGRLVRTVDELTREDHGRIYVLSSSELLNEQVLANAHLADASLPDLHERILPVSHVDARDGFPWALAQAGLIVLSDPTGYHLRPDDQRVIGVPADAVRSGRGVGAAFLRRPESFVLESGAVVSLYVRRRDPTAVEIAQLQRELAAPPGER
ncbi:hypothetical protein K2Z84_34020 [Candidatus Binatia bacterium]|nr:hypothetical protein [Candidatus Binatia bacterium]